MFANSADEAYIEWNNDLIQAVDVVNTVVAAGATDHSRNVLPPHEVPDLLFETLMAMHKAKEKWL